MPLDETDKRLLNLLQSQLPARARARSRRSPRDAELTEDEVMERTQRLLDERIIREITPIFDTPALGYSSMLVAAKVDGEHPHRAARDHQRAPGRVAQLPAQPRLQPLVHDRDAARLEARPRRHARRAEGAERRGVDPPAADAHDVQDQHEPRDGGRHRRARRRRSRRSSRCRASRSRSTTSTSR